MANTRRTPATEAFPAGDPGPSPSEVEAELWYRLAYEDLVAGISQAFVRVDPEEVDVAIDRALAEVGEFLEVDHVAVFDHDTRAAELVLSHEWSREPDRLRIATRLTWGQIPTVHEHLVKLDAFSVADTATLEGPERDALEGGSAVVVPLASGLRLVGAVMASRDTPGGLGIDAQKLLRVVGELVTSVLQRSRAYELADAVMERMRRSNADLEHLNRELIRANEVKDEFLSVASHELRSPLVSITGFSETLERRWEALTDDERRHYVEVIGRQAGRLHRLVDDLLETSRITSGNIRVDPRTINARSLIHLVLEEIQLEGVGVQGDPDIEIRVDPDHLRRIVANLVENARKYGEPPIEVRLDAEGEDFVALRIRDHGTGVPERFVPHLFEKFARAREDQQKAGTGLGLAIVRDLIVLNGGGIRYETADPGACFVVIVPRA